MRRFNEKCKKINIQLFTCELVMSIQLATNDQKERKKRKHRKIFSNNICSRSALSMLFGTQH